jgi:hypothetical protein
MNEFFTQIRAALTYRLYYLALFNIVTLPDMCRALQSENNQTNSKKYKRWFNAYITKLNQDNYIFAKCLKFMGKNLNSCNICYCNKI